VVNDRIAIALLCGADAVHLGQEDLPLRRARSWVGRKLLIGRSTHSLAQARQAQREGADYVGVGPVFSTPTKPDYRPAGLSLLGQVQRALRIPWVAIGGIDLKTLPAVLSAGASRVAVVRAVCQAADPQRAARAFQAALAPRLRTQGDR
jgi:thiamine-phosphate pyrophosphorylase